MIVRSLDVKKVYFRPQENDEILIPLEVSYHNAIRTIKIDHKLSYLNSIKDTNVPS